MGFVAARDIVGAAVFAPVEGLMERVLLRTYPDGGMNDVARKMFRFCIQKLPVVNRQNKLIGIITNADVIRSQIEKVTPEKVFDYIQTLKTLYGVQPKLSRGMVPVDRLMPTQSKVYMDELDGRSYEITKGLGEQMIVGRGGGEGGLAGCGGKGGGAQGGVPSQGVARASSSARRRSASGSEPTVTRSQSPVLGPGK